MRHKLCLNHSPARELTEISNSLSTFEEVNVWSDLLKDKFWFFENPRKRLEMVSILDRVLQKFRLSNLRILKVVRISTSSISV